ncbi:MAG TPA: flagellar basal body P-ring protein FlgI [Desulfatiglandales bacterium]|nr:flagellar basal body P-ring protein FlgI [Desulfatiglandales bacterium]
MFGRFRLLLSVFIIIGIFSGSEAIGARIKDIASIKGIRSNQLFGYGLVIGLNGSGDKGGTGFTVQGLVNMLEKMGIHVNSQDAKVSNVAAVIVSATLPPFARIGNKLDVTISSIGDAKTLQGGTLLLTPLKGVDGNIYALAQGPLSIGGFSAGGAAGGGVTKNHPTVGNITGGATVEREVPLSLEDKKELTIVLHNPDFITATRIADAVNSKMGDSLAKPIDSGTLTISIPDYFQNRVVNMLAKLEELEVTPDSTAKVIVNEKTGTVVIGENVRVLTVAVAHGNLGIQIKENKDVSQPQPFSRGVTTVTPDTEVMVDEEENRLLLVPKGGTIGELVRALNAIGVTPRDLITILQAIKAAGALQAELQII